MYVLKRLSLGHGQASQIPADRIWTVYNEKAEKYDEILITRLKGSMDSIIVFVCATNSLA